MSIRRNTRNINWAVIANAISPEFGNQLSFVQRTDQIQIMAPQFSYRWYPESWILSWGPGYNMPRLYDFDDHTLQNADYQPNVSFQFAKNVSAERERQSLDGAVSRRRFLEDAVEPLGQRQHEP